MTMMADTDRDDGDDDDDNWGYHNCASDLAETPFLSTPIMLQWHRSVYANIDIHIWKIDRVFIGNI